jgi:hypothetical protein
MTNDVQMITVVCDGGWQSWVGILPWFSTLIVPGVVVRSLFLLKHRKPDSATRSALRCYLVLHIQSVFALVTGSWISLAGMLSVRQYQYMEPGAAFFAMQNLNMSHMLWLVAYQCFIATIGSLVVMSCSGVRPRLWQPGLAVVSIGLCAVGELIALGIFRMIGN